ncbi:MAG TPA: type II toxin-antitoxin system Phd/YefM family antitoxin [Kiritimatiellia bacterium]|nr:type II toxin-antitoxin system Phd/YefM family antitoxin [Kiritimatiellia bacterium]
MIPLHPKILEHEGKKTFAVLPYDEFVRIQDVLTEYEDLKDLRVAKAREIDEPVTSLKVVREKSDL